MWVQFEHNDHSCRLNLLKGIDLTIAVKKNGNVGCYYLDAPVFAYYDSPGFTGSIDAGGSVNCEKISLYPHASGTHTECALHVAKVDFTMCDVSIPPLQMSRLVTVTPEQVGGDRVITKDSISHMNFGDTCDAIIVRTMPNTSEKLQKDYSGTNPPYFDPAVLLHLREMGYRHILTDLPSIDRESDEGRLAAHKYWFLDKDGHASRDITITELIYVENDVKDGLYVLNMQVPKIETDAVPSRILIFECE